MKGRASAYFSYMIKILCLIFVTFAAASAVWIVLGIYELDEYINPFILGALIIGLFFAFTGFLRKRWSRTTSLFFALFEGIFLGAYAHHAELHFPHIVFDSTVLVYLSMFLMLLVHLILTKPPEKLEHWIDDATKSLVIVYIFAIIFSFFDISIFFIKSTDVYGIGFSLIAITIVSLRYLLNFHLIKTSIKSLGGRPGPLQFMGWFSAFSILATQIWLFVEYLHFLEKIRH